VWTVSDETLVAGLASGDRDAASAFVQRFQRRVFGLARTIVVDDRAAEDIAQEAFVRAWKHAGAYDPRRGSVVGWLLTITRNLAIDAVRVKVPVAVDPAALLGYDTASPPRWRSCPRSSRAPSCSQVSSATPHARSARSRTSPSAPPRPASAPRCCDSAARS
jgi:RNA polymerase sigma factor (sigma-70 family)